jgi:hypothetical protein
VVETVLSVKKMKTGVSLYFSNDPKSEGTRDVAGVVASQNLQNECLLLWLEI